MLKRGVVKSLGFIISFFSVTIQFIPMSPLISSRSFLIKRSFVFIKFIKFTVFKIFFFLFANYVYVKIIFLRWNVKIIPNRYYTLSFIFNCFNNTTMR